jgi:hypothetical protein
MNAFGQEWVPPAWSYFESIMPECKALQAAMMGMPNYAGRVVWIWMLRESEAGRVFWNLSQSQRYSDGRESARLCEGRCVIDDFGYLQFVR